MLQNCQARPVRQSAAENLGELTKMSLRVDQLATDLATNAKTAEPALREAYLTALRGMLASVGSRLSPAVLSSTGAVLQGMMGTAGALPASQWCCRGAVEHPHTPALYAGCRSNKCEACCAGHCAGDDEVLRGALAGCLGVYLKHCTGDEVRQVLLRGPLGPSAAPSKWDRLGHALTLAATAASAPER